MDLVLEVRTQSDKTITFKSSSCTVIEAPLIDEDYWQYRVRLSDEQAIVGFPKFRTIGIGFQVEKEDWNTNLPWVCSSREIFDHIKENKGDANISDDDCIRAIKIIREAVYQSLPRKEQVRAWELNSNLLEE